MRLAFRFSLVVLSTLLLFALGCGNKRNPTGGATDTEKPVVLATFPAELEEIVDGQIEISFSKPMDRNSLANSIYIYPPVQNKKFSLERSTLKIKLHETLKPDCNYYVTLSTRLKDLRGNPLDANQTLIYRNGKLSTARISGLLSYEIPTDEGNPITTSLFSEDSLLVFTTNLSGKSFALENLNQMPYQLRSYIDKNQNGRYDPVVEPFFEAKTEGREKEVLDQYLAYVDTSFVRISNVTAVSNREIRIEFSEPVASYQQVLVASDNILEIKHKILENNILTLLTEVQDSLRYTVSILGATDLKGNRSEPLKKQFSGSLKKDTDPPAITYANPRNGASVNSLSPVIELHFNKIIPSGSLKLKLVSGKEEIPLKVISETGRIHRLLPQKELPNYSSCLLTVLSTTSDFSGNTLEKDYQLQFLPLKRR